MQLNLIFSISIGIASLAEYLVSARELFIENKDVFKISTVDSNSKTTLENYVNPPQVSHMPSEKLDSIKEAILGKAYEYVADCGYDLSNYKLKISSIWLNEMAKNSFHPNHYHYGANISGCFYVDMPQDCGQIKFSHNFLSIDPLEILGVANYTPENSSTWSFSPKEGDVFFWKSTLRHEVPQTNIEGIRRCIAFDISVSR